MSKAVFFICNPLSFFLGWIEFVKVIPCVVNGNKYTLFVMKGLGYGTRSGYLFYAVSNRRG
ncbi:hypothetical protein CON07_17640 [Bacillus sp. AFS094611]|uniref:Uncharacterized protein n=2 Tax=Bacillus cereus group TaxID=86661 RepID=A0A2A7D191_BACAN|nr:hypothetical protein BK707_00240 [Bacillus thuringiensis serovar coreanensis]OTX55718.1 hypothetical protein BK724_00790 [Bacillus thuringiensis serovar sooncheon]OTX59455.1 hypothetical protein BK725_02010 [Bacillus thuringiensis serovar guiyangiensis]OTX74074.1 hypothetical protein BK727_00170 [Bacillus thuringiensis serovar roskildiensis]PDZ13466.1 hypothetical protein CON16_28645 [Bacillus anthracis]PDZ50174.1 hypothetical protein CON07_17640 [Bacillus sp. AFS094611]